MRLSIYDQFIVGVVRPDGGWSKGRPIAYIEDDEKCVPLFDLLIPNDLDDEELARYVSGKFSAFAQPSKRIDAWGVTRPASSTSTIRETDHGALHS